MNVKHEIERHRLPCGAMTVAIDAVCRRRLRDSMDALLDELTKHTHPEGRDPEQDHDLEVAEHEEKALNPPEQEESLEDKKRRLIEEGKMKNEVKKEVKSHEEQLNPPEPEQEESDEEKKQRLIREGKLKADVKKEVKAYEDNIMPSTPPKNTGKEKEEESDEDKKKRLVKEGKLHVDVKKQVQNYEDKVMGNSKMTQNISGKINKR